MTKTTNAWSPEWPVLRMKEALTKSDEAVRRALIVLYLMQTPGERLEGQTIDQNRRGFNKVDAEFGSSLAKYILSGGRLSKNQLSAARSMLAKYAAQLTKLQNEGVKARLHD